MPDPSTAAPSSSVAASREFLSTHSRETALLESSLALLAWDQRVLLPPAGQAFRAEQVAFLATAIHQRQRDPRRAEALAILEDALARTGKDPALDETLAVNVRHWRREHDRASRIPDDLAQAVALASAETETAWELARPVDDWAAVAPRLDNLLQLKRQEAACLRRDGQTDYDALLDQFEPGETAASLAPFFRELGQGLTPILETVLERQGPPLAMPGPVPAARQEALNRRVCQALGFSFDRGRLDVSAHPFSTSLGPRDSRVTTRYREDRFLESLYGVLHETGHALYEMGLPEAHWGTPRGQHVSLGVHESQSRLWENMAGRSLGFCRFLAPVLGEELGLSLTPEELHALVNRVSRSRIRTEADEVTYCLHVVLRFELETALLAGELAVADLPAAWDERQRALLGLEPGPRRDGVMQDMHWFAGAFGYFPTYALGTCHAAQLFAAAARDFGGEAAMEDAFARGDFAPLLAWLRERVHAQGMRLWPRELIAEATGSPPSPAWFLEYIRRKHGV